jgi:hypothetical protein
MDLEEFESCLLIDDEKEEINKKQEVRTLKVEFNRGCGEKNF